MDRVPGPAAPSFSPPLLGVENSESLQRTQASLVRRAVLTLIFIHVNDTHFNGTPLAHRGSVSRILKIDRNWPHESRSSLVSGFEMIFQGRAFPLSPGRRGQCRRAAPPVGALSFMSVGLSALSWHQGLCTEDRPVWLLHSGGNVRNAGYL